MKLKISFRGELLPFRNQNSKNKKDSEVAQNQYALWIMILWFLVYMLCSYKANAQTSNDMKPGEKVPDIRIKHILNYRSTTAKISDFKGKLLILDFWATWCSPCIRIKPRIDSLQKQFNKQVQFISITDQPAGVAVPFLERLQKEHPVNLVEVVQDTALNLAFKPRALPQFVWIDTEGRLIGFSDNSNINAGSIQSVLNGNPLNSREKLEKDAGYDIYQPLFTNANLTGDNSSLYHSVITGYKDGLPLESYMDLTFPADGKSFKRITAVNQTIAQLYQVAMSDGHNPLGWNRTILEVRDTTFLNSSLSGTPFLEWLKNNRGFCYELVVPIEQAGSALELMRKDLSMIFPQYAANLETRTTRCLVLEVTKDTVNAPTKGEKASAEMDFTQAILKNCKLDVLTKRMELYLQKYNLPVVNLTGYKPHVDLAIHADLGNIDAVNKELSRYNLRFVKKDLETRMLVIRDK